MNFQEQIHLESLSCKWAQRPLTDYGLLNALSITLDYLCLREKGAENFKEFLNVLTKVTELVRGGWSRTNPSPRSMHSVIVPCYCGSWLGLLVQRTTGWVLETTKIYFPVALRLEV